jgi:pseudaminic acid cytidylyltransferase
MKVAIIPARGGSKRIPNKNIRIFNGNPIIFYSIKAAIDSMCFDRVIVSTDDTKISKIAKSLGAEVPFVRPEEISDDFSGIIPVLKHTIQWLEKEGFKPDYFCCIYATAPFVTAVDIQSIFKQIQINNSDYCIAVSKFTYPIQRALQIKDGMISMLNLDFFNSRSQDLDEYYHDAGQLFCGKCSALLKDIPIFLGSTSYYIKPQHLVQDIDTIEDWHRAEILYKLL